MIKKIYFGQNHWRQNGVLDSYYIYIFRQKKDLHILLITLGFKKNANFFAEISPENWRKSAPMTVTLTLGVGAEFVDIAEHVVPTR
jgi:hypothetical protein